MPASVRFLGTPRDAIAREKRTVRSRVSADVLSGRPADTVWKPLTHAQTRAARATRTNESILARGV